MESQSEREVLLGCKAKREKREERNRERATFFFLISLHAQASQNVEVDLELTHGLCKRLGLVSKVNKVPRDIRIDLHKGLLLGAVAF